MSLRHSSRAAVTPLTAAFAAFALAAPAADAGTAAREGTAVRFADPAGTSDNLAVTIDSIPLDQDADGLGGWRVSFLQYEPATTPGAGCATGFVSTVCPTGAAPPAAVQVDLGGGDDRVVTVTNTPYSAQEVTIAGGAGADHLETYQTRAALDGGDGDDLLRPDDRPSALSLPPVPTPGGTVAGGRGVDTVSYDNALDPIDVSLDGRPNDGRAGEGDDVRPDVENVVGSQFAGTLIGSAADNALRGGNGDDTIVGHAGRDDLAGVAGADTIDALDGAGGDRVDCDNGTTANDVAYADAGDAIAAGTCERIVWAPAIGSTTLRLHDGRVAVALSCPRGGSACRGDVRLRLPAGRPVALAGGRYTIRSGGRASLSLTAGRALRAALRGSRRVRATAIVSPRGRVASSGRAVIVRR